MYWEGLGNKVGFSLSFCQTGGGGGAVCVCSRQKRIPPECQCLWDPLLKSSGGRKEKVNKSKRTFYRVHSFQKFSSFGCWCVVRRIREGRQEKSKDWSLRTFHVQMEGRDPSSLNLFN